MTTTQTSMRDGMNIVRTIFLAAIVGMLATATAQAQWTQWGGPKQDFKAKSRGLAKEWPQEGPPRLWQRELGDGYSAILVDDGQLYTMYRKDGKETVVALKADTGATVWEYGYDASPREGHAKQFGEGPRSTPLIVGDRIYTIGVSGVMHCLNKKDGTVHWSHDLWTEFDGNVLNHGYSSSPIAYKDTVIVLVGGKGASIVAFDQKEGDVVWKNLDFENSYSTPKIIRIGAKDQLVTFMANEIIGVDPTSGELHWRYAHENEWKQNVCMPIWNARSKTLFFSNTGAGSRGVKLTNKGGKYQAEEIWKNRKIQFYHVTSINIDDHIYGSSGGGSPSFFSAINMKTGKIAWRKRGFAKATCVYADGRFIILDEDGNLALATATPEEFTVHSKVKLFDDVTRTVPTIVGKRLYVRDKHIIMALDLG